MIPYCNAHGIGLIPWGPLQGGDLAHPPSENTTRKESTKGSPFEKKMSEVDNAIISRVQEIAQKRDWTMSNVALAWINKRVSSPIIGFSNIPRIDEALAARGKTLTEEEERYLEELYQPKAISGHT